MVRHEAISRSEAVQRGQSYYWSDKPCRRAGHVGFRRVKTYECYECAKERNRVWNRENPEQRVAKYERFVEANPTYYVDYNKAHPAEVKAARKRYRAAHPEVHCAEVGAYQKRNRPKINARMRKWRSKAGNALRCNLASRLSMAVRNGLGKKSASTRELVGCTLAELMAYLEARFLPGMTWENYGLGADKWHVDHVRPCASFDLTNPEQQRACFHFTNLQPLWQPDNMRKGAKVPLDFVAAAVL